MRTVGSPTSACVVPRISPLACGAHLAGGVTLPPEVLSKYAGTYEFAPGREAVVTVAGLQLIVQDPKNPADRLFVARSETEFLSSLSQVVLEFVKDAQGTVTHFNRAGVGPNEKAVRKR